LQILLLKERSRSEGTRIISLFFFKRIHAAAKQITVFSGRESGIKTFRNFVTVYVLPEGTWNAQVTARSALRERGTPVFARSRAR